MGKMETNQQKSETAGITEIPAKKVRGKPFKVGQDERRNLNGKPKGTKSFDTLFEEAIRIIVKEKKIPGMKNPEIDLVIKAIIEGLKGNYPYFRDLMDRKYGKPIQPLGMPPGDGAILGVIFLPRRKQDENKQLEEPKNENTKIET